MSPVLALSDGRDQCTDDEAAGESQAIAGHAGPHPAPGRPPLQAPGEALPNPSGSADEQPEEQILWKDGGHFPISAQGLVKEEVGHDRPTQGAAKQPNAGQSEPANSDRC